MRNVLHRSGGSAVTRPEPTCSITASGAHADTKALRRDGAGPLKHTELAQHSFVSEQLAPPAPQHCRLPPVALWTLQIRFVSLVQHSLLVLQRSPGAFALH
jgi:hypothetical protein